MPIYEYQCRSCSEIFTKLIMKPQEENGIECVACGSKRQKRLISRFSYQKSEADRMAGLSNDRRDDSYYRDTRNLGLTAKKRAQELGVDLGPRFEETLEKARTDPVKFLDESSKK
ncbi:MAG: zinc ribbon domain-containing protein [Deltaproteobacteria bacterium]|nr:MAG: zinc ribbon domain-containing protein [Deltaproteobacteria bacterium]